MGTFLTYFFGIGALCMFLEKIFHGLEVRRKFERERELEHAEKLTGKELDEYIDSDKPFTEPMKARLFREYCLHMKFIFQLNERVEAGETATEEERSQLKASLGAMHWIANVDGGSLKDQVEGLDWKSAYDSRKA